MSDIHDVAKYILEKHGPMTAMKLQKLVYYSQAWSLVWDETPLFEEDFQAWANGPVAPVLYQLHKGQFKIEEWKYGDCNNLNEDQRETIDSVIEFYGDYTSQQLSDLTHSEKPWRDARKGIPDGERGENVISQADMFEFYSSL